ncbi:minor histocompatibility protein HA-1 [Clonorchis sinensis]|uniref:Minor histocompatibility protein HA-1 n=1 Tax=Clonorchis sinensis TaxID=79923 RepID=G7YP54_CLOSI|nr:minor histocompatibility protein HA-1 [Clonorchis sinensis]
MLRQPTTGFALLLRAHQSWIFTRQSAAFQTATAVYPTSLGTATTTVIIHRIHASGVLAIPYMCQVLTRQRTNFERTRKYLKDKWKTDFKRLVDAENSLFKTKAAYYQRCQTGVKLREELAAAQIMYDEISTLSATSATPASTTSAAQNAAGVASSNAASSSNSNTQTAGSAPNLAQESEIPITTDVSLTSGAGGSTSTQLAKQRAKVERLEKQLSDNDKKEIELMYAYREAVDVANNRLYDLEKSKMEILCDTRLTILKSDEVVKDSLAELFNHLYTTRIAMVKQYETIAATFQEYVPCSDYRALVAEQIQKGVDSYPEKYQFAGFHEATASGLKTDTPTATAESLDNLTNQTNNLEKEYNAACIPLARCIAAIEKQPGGLETHGIYRIPASKAKVASLLEMIQTSHPSTAGQLADDIAVLSQENPLTLAGLIKTRLIALPEPLLTYNLYPNFVELGKVFDTADEKGVKELVKRLQLLITHLTPGNRRLAGLLFHHLNRVAASQAENQMNSANLGTMFAPTVLRQRPKFQVANMMEFVDNRGQTRVVEVLIDRVTDIFGPAAEYDPRKIILVLANPEEVDNDDGRTGPYVLGKTDALQKPISLHSQAIRTQSTNPPSGEQLRVSTQGTVGQPNLMRSATISAASPGRSSALIGNPLPLYTPYRGTAAPTQLVAKEQDVTKFNDGEANSSKAVVASEATEMETPHPAGHTSAVPSAIQSISTENATEPTTSPPNSVVRNLKKLVPQPSAATKRTFGVSSIQLNLATTFGKHTGGEKTTLGSTSGAPSSLSGLVIGRRRAGTVKTSDTADRSDNKGPTDLDDYTYIDTDSPELLESSPYISKNTKNLSQTSGTFLTGKTHEGERTSHQVECALKIQLARSTKYPHFLSTLKLYLTQKINDGDLNPPKISLFEQKSSLRLLPLLAQPDVEGWCQLVRHPTHVPYTLDIALVNGYQCLTATVGPKFPDSDHPSYRGTYQTCLLSRTLERLIELPVMDYLPTNKTLNDWQYGFMACADCRPEFSSYSPYNIRNSGFLLPLSTCRTAEPPRLLPTGLKGTKSRYTRTCTPVIVNNVYTRIPGVTNLYEFTFQTPPGATNRPSTRLELFLTNVVFTEENIRQLLQKINPLCVLGADDAHPRILNETSFTRAKHFYLLIRRTFSSITRVDILMLYEAYGRPLFEYANQVAYSASCYENGRRP